MAINDVILTEGGWQTFNGIRVNTFIPDEVFIEPDSNEKMQETEVSSKQH